VAVAALNVQTVQSAPHSAVATSSSALLKNLIDYAGLFPPASLNMTAAVANYDLYLRSKWNWILGRFIVPLSRLNEFQVALDRLPAKNETKPSPPWRLSALPGSDVKSDVTRILEFNSRSQNDGSKRDAIVESVEIKISNADEIHALSKIVPPQLETYFEMASDSSEIALTYDECFAAVATNRRRAKVRTGGETADKFPTAHQVVRFIRQCAATRVAFKATAGLHHPLRSAHNFTYQPESPSGIMHGFINVFMAAAFLAAGMDDELAVQLLDEQDPKAFQFDPEGIKWRAHRLTNSEMAETRANFAISFGSCSFMEPVDDLIALHIL
jgi:hypothetical protein